MLTNEHFCEPDIFIFIFIFISVLFGMFAHQNLLYFFHTLLVFSGGLRMFEGEGAKELKGHQLNAVGHHHDKRALN